MNTDTSHLSQLGDLQRMQVLASIDLDSLGLRQKLDAVTTQTAQRLGLPISLVSLVLDTAQFLAGSHGLDGWIAEAEGTPIEWSFCAHAVASGQPYIVPDAGIDAQQCENPLVTVDGIRSYAGVPVILDGQAIGAHCVIGPDAHTFTDDDLDELRRGTAEIIEILHHYRLID